jgi:HD superfamily phosphodiesterase
VTGFKTDLVRAMTAYFGDDEKRIQHALKVTANAETLLQTEGGDCRVVIAAAVLHDIGIHTAEAKHGSASGKFQEIEGPPIAREILDRLGFPAKETAEICEIIGHHHSPGKIDTQNFKILYDADWLVNLADEYDIRDHAKLEKIVARVFLTAAGRNLAREMYLRRG